MGEALYSDSLIINGPVPLPKVLNTSKGNEAVFGDPDSRYRSTEKRCGGQQDHPQGYITPYEATRYTIVVGRGLYAR
jgi:hypothetical protein